MVFDPCFCRSLMVNRWSEGNVIQSNNHSTIPVWSYTLPFTLAPCSSSSSSSIIHHPSSIISNPASPFQKKHNQQESNFPQLPNKKQQLFLQGARTSNLGTSTTWRMAPWHEAFVVVMRSLGRAGSELFGAQSFYPPGFWILDILDAAFFTETPRVWEFRKVSGS